MILLEGQIGAGKTVFGEILERELELPLFRELHDPVTLRLLDRYYHDKRRWAYTMQTHFLSHRFRMVRELIRRGGGIMDRSIYGDRIFAQMLAEAGYMDAEEYSTYNSLLEGILEELPPPRLLIFLNCSVDTARERIRLRGREAERDIPRDYLQDLDRRYREWYHQYNLSPKILLETEEYSPDRPEQTAPLVEEIRRSIGRSLR